MTFSAITFPQLPFQNNLSTTTFSYSKTPLSAIVDSGLQVCISTSLKISLAICGLWIATSFCIVDCGLRVCISTFLKIASTIRLLQNLFRNFVDCGLRIHSALRMCFQIIWNRTPQISFHKFYESSITFVKSSLSVDQLSNKELHFGALECYLPCTFTLHILTLSSIYFLDMIFSHPTFFK